jgi:subtilisin family serine protease
VALVTGAAVTSTAPAVSAPAPTAPTQTQPAGPVHTVTLVTGDRVTVSGDGSRVSAVAGPGRDGITFSVTTVATTNGGQVRVVPSDAGPLLAAGRLDERLFDVTGLVAAGYDGAAELPLIITGGSTRSRVDGLKWTRDLPVVNGTAVRQSTTTAAESWRALRSQRAGGKVWLDGMRESTLDVSVPRVGAPAAWESGYTGRGSTVAVLDSGIDDTHPDLAGQIAKRQNFTEGYEPDADLTGHGTHVAATIAGTGAGRYKGVAPETTLLDGKVCVDGGCAESWILAGMTWAAAEQHADVVNLSLSGEDDPNVVDPIEEAVQTLSDQHGTLFVIAAGNSDGGVTEGQIRSPGTAEAALTVGAVRDDDAMANFSFRGPTGDGRLKPDLTAPGVDITAARSKDAPGGADQRYGTLSGTSMATPHVAGAAAIMAQRHPDWSGQQLKAALMASARPNPAHGVYDQGAGRLAVTTEQPVTASPASVDFGPRQWPHDDDEVRTREVTYRNDGPVAVSLELAFDSTTAGMFSLSAGSVAVPAGGQAIVTVTVDTRVGPDGHLGGWLTATGADQVLRTPVAVTKEVESYDVTLIHRDREGAAPAFFTTSLNHRDKVAVSFDVWQADPDGSATLRVPAGHYTLTSSLGGDTLLGQPDLHVDRPLTIDLDARIGLPVSVTVPRSSATQVYADIGAYTHLRGGIPGKLGIAGQRLLGTSFANLYSARLGPDTADDRFFSLVTGQWAQANAAGGTDDSPYFYSLHFPLHGRMAHGYERAVADRELAAVRVDVAQAQPGVPGTRRVSGGLPGFSVGFFGPWQTFQPPFTRTEYYSTDAEFVSEYQEWSADDFLGRLEAPSYTRYEAGRSYHERWNTAVLAPSLPDPATSLMHWLGVVRDKDDLMIDVPRFGDGAGHAGNTMVAASSATLFRDGAKIGDTDGGRYGTIGMPPDEAQYRLELHTERGAPFTLSTRTDTAWTFRSGHTEGPVALPLWTVRFSPDVDRYNALPAGGVHAVPITVTPQANADVGTLASVTVEASFDDGATWCRVPVVGGVAKVPHPRGNGFVSLRATAADHDGNTVTQTVVHAYRYGRR